MTRRKPDEPTGYTWGDCVRGSYLLMWFLLYLGGCALACGAFLAVAIGVVMAYDAVVIHFPALPVVLWVTAITVFICWCCLEWANEERRGTLYETDLSDRVERALRNDRDGAGSKEEVVSLAGSSQDDRPPVPSLGLHEVAVGNLQVPAGDQEPQGTTRDAGR